MSSYQIVSYQLLVTKLLFTKMLVTKLLVTNNQSINIKCIFSDIFKFLFWKGFSKASEEEKALNILTINTILFRIKKFEFKILLGSRRG